MRTLQPCRIRRSSDAPIPGRGRSVSSIAPKETEERQPAKPLRHRVQSKGVVLGFFGANK